MKTPLFNLFTINLTYHKSPLTPWLTFPKAVPAPAKCPLPSVLRKKIL